MKKLNYITILFASLLFCVNTYAQDSESSAETSESSAETSEATAETSEASTEAPTTTSVTSNYSSQNGTFSFSTENSDEGVAHTISIDVADGSEVNTMEMLNALANKVAKSTEDDETSESLLATLLAVTQAIGTMIDQGTFPSTISEDFTMDLSNSIGDTSNTKVNLSLGDTSYTADLSTVENQDGSYTVTGTIGDIGLNTTVTSTADSYVLTGEAGGEEIKATVSNKIDASATLENSVIETKDADGNVINTKVITNNKDGTHTVTETNADGVTTTTTYEGTVVTPYDDSTEIATPSIVEENIENLGGVGSESVYEDPTSDSTLDVNVPDTTIVNPEEFVTPEA